MKRNHQRSQPFRPTLSLARGVALWLAFLLATHAFWCGLAGSDCEFDLVPDSLALSAVTTSPVATVAMVVAHSQPSDDFCACVDETQNSVAPTSLVVAPLLLWVALAWVVALVVAPLVVALWQRAAVFGRDGPVCVPPLVGRLVRASLPHRAPPVFLT